MLQSEINYPTEYSTEVRNSTAEIYKEVSKIIPEVEWPFHAPLIHEILKLKQEDRKSVV